MNLKYTLSSAAATLCILLFATSFAKGAQDPTSFSNPYTTTLRYPDGKPASDATVYVYAIGEDHKVTSTIAKPDKDGNVTFTVTNSVQQEPVEQPWQSVVYISSPTGVCFFEYNQKDDTAPTILQPFTSLRVHVVDANGKAAAHVRVLPFEIESPFGQIYWDPRIQSDWTQTTDSDGWVTISKLPQGDRLTLDVDDPHYIPEEICALIESKNETDLDSTPYTHPATYTVENAATISGIVCNIAGDPEAGIKVSVNLPKIYGVHRDASTDANGKFAFGGLPQGSYTLALADDQDTKSDWAVLPQSLSLALGQDVHGVVLKLTRGALFTGRVTNQQTGKPVEGVRVFVKSTSASGVTDHKSALTDTDGTYTVRIAPGRATVLTQGSLPSVPDIEKPLDVHDGETHSIDFKVSNSPQDTDQDSNPPLNPVCGIVLGMDGKPAQGVTVLANGVQQVIGTTITDAKGEFSYPDIGTNDTLEALSDDDDLGTAAPLVYKGQKYPTLQLGKGNTCRITGAVFTSDGKPLAAIKVELSICYNIGGPDIIEEASDTTTDSNGHYVFKSVFGNTTYRFAIASPGYYGITTDKIKAPGGKTTVVPTIRVPDTFLGGVVVNESGKPVVNATLTNDLSSDNDVNLLLTTDMTGHFIIRGLPEKTYNLVIRSWQGRGGPYTLQTGRSYYVLRVKY